MAIKKLLVKYSAQRLATSADLGRSLGGRYVYESGEVTIIGVWLSASFYESLRRVIAERHPGFELVGPTLISESEAPRYKHCTLMSSHGEVTFDAATGMVEGILHYGADEPDDCLPNIYKVDVVRLRELFPDFDENEEIDILNAGFWYLNDRYGTKYEPPEPSHSEWSAGRRATPW